jgi:hypothetical protein
MERVMIWCSPARLRFATAGIPIDALLRATADDASGKACFLARPYKRLYFIENLLCL